MVEHLEKKIVVLIVILATAAVIAGTLIYQKKTTVNQASPTEASLQQIYDSSTQSDSSAITVGNAKEDKTLEVHENRDAGITEVKWEDLYKLDYKTGKMPDSLKKLHKTKIKIPGFIVPLSDDLSALKEFLLVPNAQACIHVPPPPPNLIVYSVLDKALPIEKVSNPSWIIGTLLIETSGISI
jgi:hypothetical protein